MNIFSYLIMFELMICHNGITVNSKMIGQTIAFRS